MKLQLRFQKMNSQLVGICFCILFFTFSSCIKPDTSKYSLDYQRNFALTAGLNPLETHVFFWDVDSGWKNFKTLHNIDDVNITQILPKSFRLVPILGGSQSFGFIEKASVYVASLDNPNFHLPVAEVYPPPNESGVDLVISPGLANIKSYITKGEFYLGIELNFRQQITSSENYTLETHFGVYEK